MHLLCFSCISGLSWGNVRTICEVWIASETLIPPFAWIPSDYFESLDCFRCTLSNYHSILCRRLGKFDLFQMRWGRFLQRFRRTFLKIWCDSDALWAAFAAFRADVLENSKSFRCVGGAFEDLMRFRCTMDDYYSVSGRRFRDFEEFQMPVLKIISTDAWTKESFK